MIALTRSFDRSSEQYKGLLAEINVLKNALSAEHTLQSPEVADLLEKIGLVKVADIVEQAASVLGEVQLDVMKAVAEKIIVQSGAHTGAGSDAGEIVADMLAAASILRGIPETRLSGGLANAVAFDIEEKAFDFIGRQGLRSTPGSFYRLAGYGFGNSGNALLSRYFVRLSQIFQDKMMDLTKQEPGKEFTVDLAKAYLRVLQKFDAEYTGYTTVELISGISDFKNSAQMREQSIRQARQPA